MLFTKYWVDQLKKLNDCNSTRSSGWSPTGADEREEYDRHIKKMNKPTGRTRKIINKTTSGIIIERESLTGSMN